MEIHCPICSTTIEVDEAHLGHKGRCPTCESKFIIPKNPDDEFEILVHGEIPDEKKESPRVRPAVGGAPRRRVPVRRVVPQSSGSSTFLFGVIPVCAAIGCAVFLANRGGGGGVEEGSTSISNYTVEGNEEPVAEPVKTASPKVAAVIPSVDDAEQSLAMVEDADEPMPDVAEPEEEAPVEEMVSTLDEKQKASALAFMKAGDPKKRAAAFKGFRDFGDREKVVYRQLLDEARVYHADLLAERAFDLGSNDNVLSKFKEAFEEWQAASEPAKVMAQTNWKDKSPKDYKKEHAEMDKLTEKAMDLYKRAVRAAERATDFEMGGFEGGLAALTEIDAEIAWTESRTSEPLEGLRDELSKAGGADDYLDLLAMIDSTNEMVGALEEAEEHNADSKWASGAYKAFATELNTRRVPLGLGPLKLDEKLSDACRDHSEDMAKNGYFSHTGLTEETKTFSNRAKRAEFSGFATGECIFMGNASPSAAHRAWWYSDGHRLIMYAGGPNTLGLGLFGKHWTLNTGKM